MGQLATAKYAAATANDLTVMFTARNKQTWQRIVNFRNNASANFCVPTADPTTATPKVRSLRFIASELTRHVDWNQNDLSRGNVRKFLKWLIWTEQTSAGRTEAKKIVEAINYFANATKGSVTISFAWQDSSDPNTDGSFTASVTPPLSSNPTQITVSVISSDIYHTNLGNVSEED